MTDEEIVRKAIDEACELMKDERCGSRSEREQTDVECLERHAALSRIINLTLIDYTQTSSLT